MLYLKVIAFFCVAWTASATPPIAVNSTTSTSRSIKIVFHYTIQQDATQVTWSIAQTGVVVSRQIIDFFTQTTAVDLVPNTRYNALFERVLGGVVIGTDNYTQTVATVPGIVTGFKVDRTFTNEIQLSWDPYTTGDSILYFYKIRIMPIRRNMFIRFNRHTTRVPKLQANTKYIFTILARDLVQEGIVSYRVAGVTDAPAPTNVLFQSTSTSLTVTWSLPHMGSARIFETFRIELTPMEGVINMVAGQKTAQITNLRPNQEYSVVVKAFYSDHTVVSSTPIIATTYGTYAPPTNIVLSNPTVTTLDASWTGSTQNVVYYLQVQPSNQNIVVDGTSTTITGLSQNTMYYLTIAADVAASQNTKVYSEPVILATLPGPPLAPTLVNVTHSTITVTAACTCSAQSPSGYQLIWNDGTSNSTNPTSPLTATGLSENTNVSLTVGGIYGSLRTSPSPASWFVTGPDKMAPPQLEMAKTTSLLLSWSQPTGDVMNFTYQLEYKAFGNSPQTIDNLKTNSTQLTGLTPNTEYEVTIKVSTPYGTSAKSNPAVNTVTSSLPPNITLTALNDTSVRVTWTPYVGGNASTVSQVQVTSSPAAFSYIATPIESTVVVRNLTGNTAYVLTVTVIYNNGQRSTAMKNLTTLSGPVTNIMAHMGRSVANLTWTAPSGNISQYRIMYGENTTVVPATQSGALISSLIPNTLYTFHIIPETAVGSGANASITTATNTAGVRDLTYTSAGQGMVTLLWLPPLGGNNLALTGYSVLYPNGMASLSSFSTKFDVTGLEEGVWHTATIVANYAALPSREITLSFALAPSNVTIHVLDITSETATLQLNPSKAVTATTYIIRDLISGSTFNQTLLYFTVGPLVSNNVYNFTATPVLILSNGEEIVGSESAPVSVITEPEAPSSLVTNAPTNNIANFFWGDAVIGGGYLTFSHYHILRHDNGVGINSNSLSMVVMAAGNTEINVTIYNVFNGGKNTSAPFSLLTRPTLRYRPNVTTSTDTAYLSWSAYTEGNFAFYGYIVSYTVGPSQPVTQYLEPNTTQYTFTGLESNTEYIFSISIQQKIGNPVFALGSTVISTYPKAPENVTQEVTQATAIVAQWSLNLGGRFRNFLKYEFFYEPNGHTSTTGTTPRATMQNLIPSHLYNVTVTAVYFEGPNISTTAEFWTSPTAQVVTASSNSSGVYASWVPFVASGPVDYYTIIVTGLPEMQVAAPTTSVHVIPQPNTPVSVQVFAHANRGGVLRSSLSTTADMVNTEPAPTGKPNHGNSTATTILVVWPEPSLGGNLYSIDSYAISVNGVSGSNTAYSINQHEITGLVPNTLYNVSVILSYNGGQFSKTSEFSVFGTAPGAVQQVNTTNQTASSITISWSPVERADIIHTSYEIFINNRTINTNLTTATIDGLDANTLHSFNITAYNTYGRGQTISKQARTAFGQSPVPSAMSATSSSITLGINPGANFQNVTMMRLMWSPVDVGMPNSMDLPGNTSSVTIPGLLPEQTYFFELRLENALGVGQFSEVFSTQTAPAQLKTPAKSTVDEPTATSVTLEWLGPETIGGLSYTHYIIEYTAMNASTPGRRKRATTTVPASALTITVTGLEPNTLYCLTIAAVSAAGIGNASDPICVSTAPHAPENIVLSMASATTTTISLMWSPPQPGGGLNITGYRVIYKSDFGNGIKNVGTSLSTTLENLTPAVYYLIFVQAMNVQGYGNISNPLNTTTASDIECSIRPNILISGTDYERLNLGPNDNIVVSSTYVDSFSQVATECKPQQLNPSRTSISFNFQSCNPIVEAQGIRYQYNYTVKRLNFVGASSVQRYGSSSEITFSCYFNKSLIVHFSEIKPMMVFTKINNPVQPGTIDLSFGLYQSSAYSALLSGNPPVISSSQYIYAQISAGPTPSDNTILQAMYCWATQTSDSSSNTRYNILQNGCPVASSSPNANIVTINYNSSIAQFQFQAFTWVGAAPENQTIYVHCQISVCMKGASTCPPLACSKKRKRRGIRNNKLHLLSYGPLLLAPPQAESCKTNNGGCEDICFMHKGMKTCSCREGMTLDNDGVSCYQQEEPWNWENHSTPLVIFVIMLIALVLYKRK